MTAEGLSNETTIRSFGGRLGCLLLFLEQGHGGRIRTGLENCPRSRVGHSKRILAGLDCSSHSSRASRAKEPGRAPGSLLNAPGRGLILSNALSLLARRWTAGDRVHQCSQGRDGNREKQQRNQQLADHEAPTTPCPGAAAYPHPSIPPSCRPRCCAGSRGHPSSW